MLSTIGVRIGARLTGQEAEIIDISIALNALLV